MEFRQEDPTLVYFPTENQDYSGTQVGEKLDKNPELLVLYKGTLWTKLKEKWGE